MPSVRAFLVAALLAACSAPVGTSADRAPAADSDRPAKDDKKPSSDPSGSEPTAPPADDRDGVIGLDLGPVTDGAVVLVDVPEHALGFNVSVTSEGKGLVGVQRIESPSGTIVHDDFMTKGGTTPRAKGESGAASASVPANDLLAAPEPGRWKVTFGGEGTNPHAHARIQTTSDGKFHGGKLDLHFHIPAGLVVFGDGGEPSATSHEVDAASAPTDPALSARIHAYFALLEKVFGIGRGAVTFHDAAARFDAVNDDPTYYAGTSVSKGIAAEHAVQILVTNDLYEGEYNGYSPLPGTAGVTGNASSGLIWGLYQNTTARFDGAILLHETGHFFGLQHTQEFSNDELDPLADTPACGGEGNACAVTNLMEPVTPDSIKDFVVSPTQKRIFQSSPVYRAFFH